METHTLDASKKPLGRIASQAAVLLMGKHKPTFERYKKEPLQVVITNSDALIFTGKKLKNKRYYRHSGYLGNLKEETAEEMLKRDSRKIIRLAIIGMLPKNKLRKEMIKRLVILKGQN